MTEGWDERTEAVPGTRSERSLELDVDLSLGDPSSPDDTQSLARPCLVVFEPSPVGLAEALGALGYEVEIGATGVEVMGLVASRRPAAVLCAPAPDAERRRLLTAALRMRFPNVPTLYVSTHAVQAVAVEGALREGARAVLPWPLPAAAEVLHLLEPFVRRVTDETELVARPPPPPPAGLAGGLGIRPGSGRHAAFPEDEPPTDPERPPPSVEEPLTVPVPRPPGARGPTGALEEALDGALEVAPTQVLPTRARAPVAAPPIELHVDDIADLPLPPMTLPAAPPPPLASRPNFRPAGEVLPVSPGPRPPTRGGSAPVPVMLAPAEASGGFELEPRTEPGLRPAAVAAAEAAASPRGELGELLAAISPFLWSLEDAARWADSLAAAGDANAAGHARALHLLAKILAQLQARIDESER
jgi:hypothetical protein